MNMLNTVSMSYRKCYTPGGLSELAYTQRATGVGTSYQERLLRQEKIPERGVELVVGSLMTHIKGQHRAGRGD